MCLVQQKKLFVHNQFEDSSNLVLTLRNRQSKIITASFSYSVFFENVGLLACTVGVFTVQFGHMTENIKSSSLL